MNALRNTLGALAAITFFFGAIAMTASEPSDIEALADTAMAHDDAVIEARIQAMSATENERRAWSICRSFHAERAVVQRLADTGEFVCRRAERAL